MTLRVLLPLVGAYAGAWNPLERADARAWKHGCGSQTGVRVVRTRMRATALDGAWCGVWPLACQAVPTP